MDLKQRLLGSNQQYSRYPLSRFCSSMAQLGLNRLDFVPQVPHFWCGHTGYESTAGLKAALAEAGLAVSALTPPPYRYSITAPDGKQRMATLDYYRHCIALAAELGAGQVVVGAAGACWDLDPAVLRRNAADMLLTLARLARDAGIRLLFSPVMGPDAPLLAESPILGTAAETAELLDWLDQPSLGVCLDTNVMSVWGGDLPTWFRLLGGRIRLVRLCDGNYHGYRAWGDGCLPMERYLRQLDEAGYAGDLSLLLPGERYVEDPEYPDRAALRALCGEV